MKPITIFLREVNSGQALRIDLPTCETDFCTRLRSDGTTFYIEKIRFDDMLRAEKLLMHSISFNELNYLALLYEALSDANKQLYKGVIESGCRRINGAKDLINLTQSLDCFYMLRGVATPALLCAYYLSAAARYNPKPILKKIKPEDYSEIGDILIRRQHGGFFNGNYYAMRSGCTLKDFYCGNENDIPKDARIFL